MQSSKISAIFDSLDTQDAKTASKIFLKEYEKNAKKINADSVYKIAV